MVTPTSNRLTTSFWPRIQWPGEWRTLPFEAIPYCLSFKCDGCLYNEFCMKWRREGRPVAAPLHDRHRERALRRAGITTVQSLAT